MATKKKKSNLGGYRPGSGRPKGTHMPHTLEKKRVEAEMRNRILANATKITNRMLQLAEGCSYLYKYTLDKNGNKKKAELVTDEEEIKAYLDGDVKDNEEYHFITTDKPDFKALESMLDRVFGKATQKVEAKVTGSIGHFGIGHDELTKLDEPKKSKVIEVQAKEVTEPKKTTKKTNNYDNNRDF
jgi:hypothetical protein